MKPGGFEVRIAVRYLRARRRQILVSVVTLISVIGVMTGVAALVIALALMSGFQDEVRGRILGATPHIVALPRHGRPSGVEPLTASSLADRVARLPSVAAASPVSLEFGLLSSPDHPEGIAASFKGVDPGRYAEVTDLAARMEEGALGALAQEDGLILGAELAAQLGVRRGGIVRVWTTRLRLQPFGPPMPRSLALPVLGTFRTGYLEYDGSWALLSYSAAAKVFAFRDEDAALEIRARDLGRIDQAREEVRGALGPGWSVVDWQQINRPLFSAFKLEKLLMFLTIGLIVLVAALNIVTTLVLTVMEKTRDIGILRAMGARPSSILGIFMAQGLVVGLCGTALGVLLGVGAARVLDAWQVFRLDPSVYFIPYVPFRVHAAEVAITAALAVAVSFLATLYPAWSAARLDPVEALRFE